MPVFREYHKGGGLRGAGGTAEAEAALEATAYREVAEEMVLVALIVKRAERNWR